MKKQLSYWERQYYFEAVDFTIVGGGIVGLSTAYYLKKKNPKAKIVILERDFPGYGASTKNAGFACFGSASEILSDLKTMSEAEIVALIKLRWEGLNLLKSLIDPNDMDYLACGAEELFDVSSASQFEYCMDHLKQLNDLTLKATGQPQAFTQKENINFNKLYKKCLYNPYEGQLNPMKMIARLSAKVVEMGVIISYHSSVKEILGKEKCLDIENLGLVSYNQLFVCTNGFAKSLLPEIEDLKTVRNQVVITEEIKSLSWSGTFHMDQGYIYFRNYKNRILLGGARNIDLEGETTDKIAPNSLVLAHLRDFLYHKLEVPVQVQISDQWSGILGVGAQKSPIVKSLGRDINVGIRMGGMGVAIGSAIGHKLATIND